jgi:hypothetical protein
MAGHHAQGAEKLEGAMPRFSLNSHSLMLKFWPPAVSGACPRHTCCKTLVSSTIIMSAGSANALFPPHISHVKGLFLFYFLHQHRLSNRRTLCVSSFVDGSRPELEMTDGGTELCTVHSIYLGLDTPCSPLRMYSLFPYFVYTAISSPIISLGLKHRLPTHPS